MPTQQTCGHCRGTGRQPHPQRDAYGPRPDYPVDMPCEYCSGTGACERGDELEPARYPERAVDPTAGNPAWG